MKELDKISRVAFFMVLGVALAISWWSLFTLAMSFAMPVILAVGVSFAFDGAALFLAGIAGKYARSEDSGFLARVGTFALVVVSVVLNVMHASALGLGLMGMLMFGAAPLIAGLLFEVYLRYVHRQTLRDQGRVLKRLPLTGKLAMAMHPIVAYRVYNKAIKERLYLGAKSVSDIDYEDEIFGRRTKTPKTVKTIKATVVREDKTEDTPKAIAYVSEPKTETKDMSVQKIVASLWGQGINDRDILTKEVSRIKGQDIPRATINKSLSRAGLV